MITSSLREKSMDVVTEHVDEPSITLKIMSKKQLKSARFHGRAPIDATVEEPDPVMYFVVNKSLDMGKGKIAAQVAHAAIECYKVTPRGHLFHIWDRGHFTKVVLYADEETMLALHKKHPDITVLITDANSTQVPDGSHTVLAFHIMQKGSCQDLHGMKIL